jgi:hypothetical protein
MLKIWFRGQRRVHDPELVFRSAPFPAHAGVVATTARYARDKYAPAAERDSLRQPGLVRPLTIAGRGGRGKSSGASIRCAASGRQKAPRRRFFALPKQD